MISIDNYYLIRNYCEGKQGGGVACYIHNSLQAKILHSSPSNFSNTPEYIIFDVRFANSKPLLFASIYRRPAGRFLHELIANFDAFAHAYKNIVISGVLNCNMLKNNAEAMHMRDFISFTLSRLVPPFIPMAVTPGLMCLLLIIKVRYFPFLNRVIRSSTTMT